MSIQQLPTQIVIQWGRKKRKEKHADNYFPKERERERERELDKMIFP